MKMELTDRDLLAPEREAKSRFYASDLSDNFVRMIERILGRDADELEIYFKNLDI